METHARIITKCRYVAGYRQRSHRRKRSGKGCGNITWYSYRIRCRRPDKRHFFKWYHTHRRKENRRGTYRRKGGNRTTEQLVSLGFESGRMKTGTPPRVDGRSLHYSLMEEQWGDEKRGRFSYTDVDIPTEQRCCWITYTNDKVHDVLKTGFEKSPMFTGRIKGLGPRYCPSIEDKINRFAERDRHQIFVEPEGFKTVE